MRIGMHVRGFSLIELMIAISIFALLIVLAGPIYGEFMANTQIRNAGESMLNGVRLAQAQAVRYNLPTEFQWSTTGWVVTTDDPENPGTPLPGSQEIYQVTEGAAQAKITPTPGAAKTVTFGGLGRIEANADASPTLEVLDIVLDPAKSGITTSRPLRIVVANTTSASGTKLCDPDPVLKLADPTNPQLCP